MVALLGLFLFGVFGATNLLDISPLEFPEATPVPVPEPSKVDAVVFLLGDPGATMKNLTPLLPAIQAEIERWSAAFRRDSAVSVVFLGDNVYPQGVHNRDDSRFPKPTPPGSGARLNWCGGTEAPSTRIVGLFVTGNHDWVEHGGRRRVPSGPEPGRTDCAKAARPAGTSPCCPLGGDPGPVIRDLRRNVRIAFFDTHWFLQERSAAQRLQYLRPADARP